MKKTSLTTVIKLLFMTVMLGSCTSMPEAFESGMGIGIFAVLAVLVVVAFIIMKARNK